MCSDKYRRKDDGKGRCRCRQMEQRCGIVYWGARAVK